MKTGVFDSPCGSIRVSPGADGLFWVELLDLPPAESGYPEAFLVRDWPEIRSRLSFRRTMDDLADRGRHLKEREDDELEALLVGPDVNRLFADVIPGRAADRARAGVVLRRLLEAGHAVEFRHGAARVEPDPPPELAAIVDELQPYLCDLLQEGNDAFG